jgi:hypothetical protein
VDKPIVPLVNENALCDVLSRGAPLFALQLDLNMAAKGHWPHAAVDLDGAGVRIGRYRKVLLTIEEDTDSIVTCGKAEIVLKPFVRPDF